MTSISAPPHLIPVGQAGAIDGVLLRLDEILQQCLAHSCRMGYFTALYRRVTRAVKRGIADGRFEHPELMAELDVVFANRFLSAWDSWVTGAEPTAAWTVAFRASRRRLPVLLQHLELGISAHIMLDLGIATAEVVGAERLAAFQRDFDEINLVLAELVATVDSELAEVWPPLGWINHLLKGPENGLIHLGLVTVRDSAWGFTERLALIAPVDRAAAIAVRDRETAALSEFFWHPGLFARVVLLVVRCGELGSVRRKIEVMMG